ncbi:hypothetical protein XENTR_v10019892 [Xenopus tropicalis]|nr:hypothetical protein XENTR_v10019892 [Xenopus tropicalis]|eukprot:XP_012809844.1 PREDICTED: immunoglobulin omega chain-like isoform X2 [Xenopus tropicalis]
MESADLTLLLVSLALSCCAQIEVHQPRRMVATEGGTAQLSCSLSGQQIQNLSVHWFQQMPGGPPSFILLHYSNATIHRGDAFSQHFQPMRDIGNNTHFLLIPRVTTNDSARQRCVETFCNSSEK